MSNRNRKTKPPMLPGPEADGHNLDETIVPRKPMTADEPTEPTEPTESATEPEPAGEGTGEGEEGKESSED